MTLLVGVLCTDGVVIGSDSAATLGSGVLQSPVKKVHVVNDSILVATAGTVGLGQRFRHVVAQAADDGEFQAMDLVGKGVSLSERGLQNFKRTSSDAKTTSALVAISTGKEPGSAGLIEFSSRGFSPSVVREGVRFTAAGSGATAGQTQSRIQGRAAAEIQGRRPMRSRSSPMDTSWLKFC